MFHMLKKKKKKKASYLPFKTQLKVCKTSDSCNYSKQKRMVLSYSIKHLSALLRGITSKHNSCFRCLNCLRFSRTNQNI